MVFSVYAIEKSIALFTILSRRMQQRCVVYVRIDMCCCTDFSV